MITQKYT